MWNQMISTAMLSWVVEFAAEFLETGETGMDFDLKDPSAINQSLQDRNQSLDFVVLTGREKPVFNFFPYVGLVCSQCLKRCTH